MDIYSFINSPDIADYCRKINKVWNPFDMAVIIGRSNKPMLEKHAAWRELISDYPDMPTPKNMHYASYDSLHEKLNEVINYEEHALEVFKRAEAGVVYTYKVSWYDDYRHSDTVFSSFEMAFNDYKDRWEQNEAPRFVMSKVYIDNKGRIEADLDYESNIIDLSIIGCSIHFSSYDQKFPTDLDLFCDMFYVDIPLPFKLGDILIFPSNQASKNDRIFVLKPDSENDKKRQSRLTSREIGDGSDMILWGYYVDDDGILYGDHTGYYDCIHYYRGKLEGNQRLLHYVSLYQKNEIGLPELLTMQCRIMLEHQLANNLRVDTHGCYIPDDLII